MHGFPWDVWVDGRYVGIIVVANTHAEARVLASARLNVAIARVGCQEATGSRVVRA